uniref:Uncharacterized protein n=2 Tax=Cucumis sativus TaxID=3659 RepID=A0A0A0K946_CUCSA
MTWPSFFCIGLSPPTTTWNESTDCCLWDGVECDDEGQGHVVGLHLGCSLLQGTLHPNNTLFTLSHLQTLNLSYNYMDGSPFSPQFGMLTDLRVLDLSRSFFQGNVPLQISHLTNLVSLHLSYNDGLSFSNMVMNQLVHNLTNLKDLGLAYTNLSDITPSSNFMNFSLSLESLDLSASMLSGYFPDYILSLKNFHVLKLYHNPELNGHLPKSNWSKSLQVLDLSQTHFSGGIPNSISEAKVLSYLDLSDCNFNGEIPNFETHSNPLIMGQLVPNCVLNLTQTPSSSTSFTNDVCSDIPFPNLVYLSLEQNSFIDAIPSWIFSLPNLKSLDLGNNNFFGFMKDFQSNSLEFLDFSYNNLQGEISESIYRQLNLTYLGLEYNNLSGVLNLDMLLRITRLHDLFVSNNSQLSILSTNVSSSNLTSIRMASLNLEKVPHFLKYHKKLEFLDLSNNQIVGKVPEWFSEMSGLNKLDLSHNFLSTGIEVLHAMPNLMGVDLSFNLFNKLPVPILLPSTMEMLIVSNNEISGNIHSSICQATNLNYLDLSYNSFSGELPSCLSNMTNLQTLVLKSNNFVGPIPMPTPSISFYIASENQFIGEIPRSICLSIYLRILSISNNRMSGTIPPCLASITSLTVLDLKNNNFSGTIPTFFSTECQLSRLDLNNNQIEGELPQSLLNCEYLQVLDLGKNKITGYFPSRLKPALYLQVIILRSNQFYGHINDTFHKDSFSNLRIIDLSHNNFDGPLPSNFIKNMRAIREVENRRSISFQEPEIRIYYRDSIVISSKGTEQKFERILLILKTIDLSSNDFSGEIPEEIGMLRSLIGLNLSHNKLTGRIPTSIGNLNNLEWLDLSSNQLLGSIPPQLVALTFLSCLNLSQNQLSGPIPEGKQFDTFESSSYLGNLGLCGNPLPKCEHPNDHKSQVLHEEEEGESCGKGTWVKAVFIGYGCGIIFGVFVGYVVFECGKPVWIVAIVEGKRSQKIQTSKSSRGYRKRNK